MMSTGLGRGLNYMSVLMIKQGLPLYNWEVFSTQFMKEMGGFCGDCFTDPQEGKQYYCWDIIITAALQGSTWGSLL